MVEVLQISLQRFSIEVIANENNAEIELKEEGCRYRLNVAEMYWNSLLQFENRRPNCSMLRSITLLCVALQSYITTLLYVNEVLC